jgi:hypothetical protein
VDFFLIEPNGTVLSSSQHHQFRHVNKGLKPLIGVVLTVEPCDDDNNLTLGKGNYRGTRHECTILCGRTYDTPDILIPNVIITSPAPSSIDNYSENIPRGCTRLVDGNDFNFSLEDVNPFKLDGEWCIVNFIDGNSVYPYVSNWIPHPANIFDPSTSGRELEAGDSVKSYLVQADLAKGRSRSFSASNGVVHLLSIDGNSYLDTTEAGRKVIIDEDNKRKVINVEGGGHIQVDIKKKAQLEFNWNIKPTKGPRIGAGSNSTAPIQESAFPHYDDPTNEGTPEARETKRTTIRHDEFSMLQKTSNFSIFCEDQSAEEDGKSGEYNVLANDAINLSIRPANGDPVTLTQMSDGTITLITKDGSTVSISNNQVIIASSGGASVMVKDGQVGVIGNSGIQLGGSSAQAVLTTFGAGLITEYLALVGTAMDALGAVYPPAKAAGSEVVTTLVTALTNTGFTKTVKAE